MINAETVVAHQSGIQFRKYLKSIIIEPEITLNETAAFIFERIDGTRSLSEICTEMTSIFDVEYDRAMEDIFTTIDYLMQKEVIQIREG